MKFPSLYFLLPAVALFSMTDVGASPAGGRTETLMKPRAIEAPEEFKTHFAVRAGLTTFEDGYSSPGSLGIEAGVQPFVPIGLAIEGTFTDISRRGSGDSAASISRSKLMGKGSYHLGGTNRFIRHSYLGAEVGAIFDQDNAGSRASFGWGPMAGFDLPLSSPSASSGITLGLAASYLFVANNSSDNLNLDGVIKYWF